MPDSEYPPLSDYAIIGDARTAALVSCHGSIDWLCFPRFDSPSLFNRLLDVYRGGHFSISPQCGYSARRWYREASAVLVTEFHTDRGTIRVTDVMPVTAEEDKHNRLSPFRSVIRHVEGVSGSVPVQISFNPRPDHARVIPRFQRRGHWGYFADLGSRLIHLAATTDLGIKDGEVSGCLHISPGQSVVLWMAYSEDAPSVYPCLQDALEMIEQTSSYWQRWAKRCRYRGPYRDNILRSALTLKLLTFAPSGAIVAAPTTSLPETIGGTRNWDYRYCWLRDASYTASLFFRLGYEAEAEAFVRWLMHATALTYPALQVVYDVHGEAHLPQRCLEYLEGYRRSAPVRIGNQAHGQFQLDVYGEVLDALLLFVESGHQLDREMVRRVLQIAEVVMSQWTFPDHGMWEIPGRRKHYVHSKVMCWVALERAERLVRRLGVKADVGKWAAVRDHIRETVLAAGFSASLQSFVQTFGSHDLDALALTFPLVGFIQPDDPRVRSTLAKVRETLGEAELLYRYRSDDGLAGKEGAFLACSFWLVEALVLSGQREEAEKLFQQAQQRANDVGLYSEEIEPSTGLMLGNFPQALTHLAHLSAGLRLYERP